MIDNNFLSEYLWQALGNSWDFYENRPEANAYWDSTLHKVFNAYLQSVNVDAGKGLFTVPIEPKSERHLFIFDATTSTTPNVLLAVEAYTIDEDIVSVEQLEDSIISPPTLRLEETTDYVVSDGVINFFAPVPKPKMWAFVFKSNREQIRNNFAGPIEFFRPNGLSYLYSTQGLWYALWNGPAVRRVGVGLQILLGLPFARDGRVTGLEELPHGETNITVISPSRENIEIIQQVPAWLDPAVVMGEELLPFSRLSNGIEIYDWVNNTEIVEALVVPIRNKFHTWVIFAKAEVIQNQVVLSGQFFELDEVTQFVERFKPEYTDWVFGIDLQLEEGLLISNERLEVDYLVDLTSRTEFNYWNFLQYPPFLAENPPFTEDAGDPPRSTPWPAQESQEFALDEENMKFLDELTIYEFTSPATILRTS